MCSPQKIAVCQDDPLNDLGRPGPPRIKISLGKCGSPSWEFPCVRTLLLYGWLSHVYDVARERKREEDSVREGRRKGDRERKRERAVRTSEHTRRSQKRRSCAIGCNLRVARRDRLLSRYIV